MTTTISIANAFIQDGKAIFRIVRTGELSAESAIRFHSEDGTATGEFDLPVLGADFKHVAGTIILEAGKTQADIPVVLMKPPISGKVFTLILDATSFGTFDRASAFATLGDPAPARDLPTATIDQVQLGGNTVVKPLKPTALTAAFDKELTALLAKYSTSKNTLDQAKMLAVAAQVTGRLIAVQDPRKGDTSAVMAALNINLSAGFTMARAKLNTVANLTAPTPALAKVLTGGATGHSVN